MKDTAFVFPGQGSQFVGMGKDLYDSYPAARTFFEKADEVLEFALSRLCFEGPEDELNDTYNTQPALLVVSAALLELMNAEELNPAYMAGHSMGEYTALYAAGVLSFEDALRLTRERGRLMKEAGENNPGGMAAIIALSDELVDQICQRATAQHSEKVVQVANYNCPGQVVITGHEEPLLTAMELAQEAKARKVVRLPISIASHSPLMRHAADELKRVVASIDFGAARIPIVGNVTAAPLTEPHEFASELVQQLTNPVRWVESVQLMLTHGVSRFVEIGAGNVLTGLIKRINRKSQRVNVGTVAELEAFLS